METEKTFADSKRTVCLGTGEAKFEVEYQESLPQYCEDVERVVRCVCSHAVTDYEYASGSLRVTAAFHWCISPLPGAVCPPRLRSGSLKTLTHR